MTIPGVDLFPPDDDRDRTDTTCMVCSGPNPDWHTNDNLWAFGLDYKPDFRRVFCPNCFIAACEDLGLRTVWRLVATTDCAECKEPFALIDVDDELCSLCIALNMKSE